MTNKKIIAEGAEAQILKINETTLKKIRLPKPYRLKQIDNKIRKQRNNREFKILTKLYEANIPVPKPIENITKTNKQNKNQTKEKEEISFTFQYIKGKVLKKTINKQLLKQAFEIIIKLHKLEITHGDLTTLNIITNKNNKIILIDFGLSEFTQKIESRAVDLNLFFTCIKNEHPQLHKEKQQLLNQYKKKLEFGQKVLTRLEKLEHRGRNK